MAKYYSSMKKLKMNEKDSETLLYTLNYQKSEIRDMIQSFQNDLDVLEKITTQLESLKK